MAEELTINYIDVDVEHSLTYQSPQQKNVPKSNPPQTYHEVPLQYNYGDTENPKVSEFLFEFPEVYSNGGIIEKPAQNGKIESSVMISLPQDNPETKLLIERLEEIWTGCCAILNNFRGQIGLSRVNFKSADAALAAFKQPVYFPVDKVTNERIQGRNPSMFLKCFRRGFGPLQEKTNFVKPMKKTDAKGHPVFDENGEEEVDYESMDWELLKGVEMKFIPLVHIKKIYVGGGKASIQMEMVSAIVTYLSGRGTMIKNSATIKNLIKANPNLPNTLEEQIAKLTANRNGTTIEKPVKPETEKNPNKDDPLLGTSHQISETSSMQNFLSGMESNSSPTPSPQRKKSPMTLKMPVQLK